MVLESISNPFQAENKPSKLIAMGFVYCVLAILLSTWIFKDQASLVFVFLTVMASIPLMMNIIKEEEKKDLQDIEEVVLLKEHSRALIAFMALFLGVTLGVVATYVYTPLAITLAVFMGVLLFSKPDASTGKVSSITMIVATVAALALGIWAAQQGTDMVGVFQTQIDTIKHINGRVTGLSTVNTGSAFAKIFLNNIKVLVFCILFSFLYGAGAIFILTWNASVIGTAVGNFIRSNLATVAHLVGLEKASQYFSIITIGLFKYIIHGVPEILGYFVAALAGGIISIGVIRHDFEGRKFEHIVLDAADLILLSIGIIFVAAALEVWITPLIF
ncbi:MAG: stage II sporulation protein M [Nanoarchaeota archaeon]|nr:stage II sporulation protein M [Nanoarchaeota archaeon]